MGPLPSQSRGQMLQGWAGTGLAVGTGPQNWFGQAQRGTLQGSGRSNRAVWGLQRPGRRPAASFCRWEGPRRV